MKSLWAVFKVPLQLAVVSIAGLLSALLGDGAWDAVSWVLLGVLVAVVAWYGAPGLRQRRRSE